MEKPKYRGSPPIAVRNRQEIKEVIGKIWASQEHGVKGSIDRRLYQYNLTSIEANEIFSDAVIRAIKHLGQNEDIPNFVAWLKLTSYNIIREKSKKELRQAKIVQKMQRKNDFLPSTEASRFSRSENEFASLLVNRLSEPEKSIIHLMSEGLSWKKICIELSKKGLLAKETATNPVTIERIKKRGHRTANKLKLLIEEANKLHR